MWTKIKQIFNEWLENALTENMPIRLPSRYKHKQISAITIKVEDENDEQNN